MRVVCIHLHTSSSLGMSADLQRIAEACLRFTPQIAVGWNAVFLEIGACLKLYSEKNLLLRLQVVLRRLGVHGVIRVSADVPTSLAVAKYGGGVGYLPIEALQEYVTPFVRSDSMAKVIGHLKHLGVYKLRDLLVVPRTSLASRFGKETLMALHHIDHASDIVWPRFHVQEKIVERSEVDDSFRVTELEPVLFVLRGILDRVLLRVRGQGKLLSLFEVRFEIEPYSFIREPFKKWDIELTFPVGSPQILLNILRERIGFTLQREPLESPLIGVEIVVSRAISSTGRQTDFFSKKEEELESFHAVVARLVDRLGSDRAFMAMPVESYVPEKSWKKTLEVPTGVASPVSLRPLRILKKPMELQHLDNRIFFSGKKRWIVEDMIGPERLSGEWWLGGEERNYYRAKTSSGEELWIYNLTGVDQYFLHGIFD